MITIEWLGGLLCPFSAVLFSFFPSILPPCLHITSVRRLWLYLHADNDEYRVAWWSPLSVLCCCSVIFFPSTSLVIQSSLPSFLSFLRPGFPNSLLSSLRTAYLNYTIYFLHLSTLSYFSLFTLYSLVLLFLLLFSS